MILIQFGSFHFGSVTETAPIFQEPRHNRVAPTQVLSVSWLIRLLLWTVWECLTDIFLTVLIYVCVHLFEKKGLQFYERIEWINLSRAPLWVLSLSRSCPAVYCVMWSFVVFWKDYLFAVRVSVVNPKMEKPKSKTTRHRKFMPYFVV